MATRNHKVTIQGPTGSEPKSFVGPVPNFGSALRIALKLWKEGGGKVGEIQSLSIAVSGKPVAEMKAE